jgi:hypothetical protein
MAHNCKIKAANGTVIAAVPTRCPLTWEDPANAYLIAAAPDLLEAYLMALDKLGMHPDAQILRNAIAEATGRTVEGWMSV